MEALELKATNDRMNEDDIVQLFDNDSCGLILFDRHLGKMMLTQENLTHPIFGLKFKSYSDRCHAQRRSAKGRVLLALMALRFRIDRHRGRMPTQLSVQLGAQKLQT